MVYKHDITHTNSHLNFKISSLLYSRIDKTFSHLKHKINSEISNSLYIFNKDRVLNILLRYYCMKILTLQYTY